MSRPVPDGLAQRLRLPSLVRPVRHPLDDPLATASVTSAVDLFGGTGPAAVNHAAHGIRLGVRHPWDLPPRQQSDAVLRAVCAVCRCLHFGAR